TFAFEFNVANYLTVPATAKSAPGSINTGSSGFLARVYQVVSPAVSSLPGAERQLAGELGPNVANNFGANPDGTFSLTTVNWDDDQAGAGNFPADDPIPGYPGYDADGFEVLDNIVIESIAYLDLPAGVVTLGVTSDDGFKLTIGANPRDVTAPVIASFTGVSTTTASFVVEEAGIYGVRLLWYEGGGDAHAELYSVNAAGEKILVNDRSTPGHIKAYRDRLTAAPPYISSAKPAPGETGVSPKLSLEIVVTEDVTVVNPDSIQIQVRDTVLTPTVTKSGKRTTISYQHPGHVPEGVYPVVLSFADASGNTVTSAWEFFTLPGACENVSGPAATGYWTFDGDLSATIGEDITYIDNALSANYAFGTSGQGDYADIPGIGGQATKFLVIPRNEDLEDSHRTGLRVKPGLPPSGGGVNANVWTLVMDLYWGEGHGFGTVLRTRDLDQNNDGDLFWRASDGSYGKGCCSNYDGINPAYSHQRGTWARVVFVADMTSTPKRFAKYINGVKHRDDPSGDGANLDGRYSLPPEIYMFNDGDDNEQSTVLINSMQFRPVALTDDEVAALGGPSASGVPEPQTTDPSIKGHWTFEGDLSATIGEDIAYIDNALSSHYAFGTSGQGDYADIPAIGGQPAQFLAIPRNENGEDFRRTGLRVKTGLPANGGGVNANIWTLVLDLYWGEGHGFGTVLRTRDLDQNNDGDLFWRASDGSYGKGCCSNYDGINPAYSHQRNTWARVVFVADMTSTPKRFAKYINGVKHRDDPSGDGANLDGRYSLPPEIFMFNDGDDNEQSTVLVSAIQFRDGALTDDEVAALGGPTADGPPIIGSGGDTCVPLGLPDETAELLGSDTLGGGYTVEAGAAVDVAAKTIRVAAPAGTKFYRIRGTSVTRVKSVTVDGANLVLVYE
ncbi:MAG: hypothetical protein KIT22_01125, partial [Verrucomicrobiae bacterium]|nr:hypothetical protein [Verrucomicrobiae bacterium]